MTTLIRLESPDDPLVGGLAITYPSGACRSASWRALGPVGDSLGAAKQYAAALLQNCMDEGRLDDAERTNWASVTAAVQRIVMDWSDLRRAALRAQVGDLRLDS